MTDWIDPLKNMRSIDHVKKVYISNHQFLPTLSRLKKQINMIVIMKLCEYRLKVGRQYKKKYIQLRIQISKQQQIILNKIFNDYFYEENRKISEDKSNDDVQSSQKLKDNASFKEISSLSTGFAKRIQRRVSSDQENTKDETLQNRQKSSTASNTMNNLTNHESYDSLIIKNYFTNTEENKYRVEQKNSFPNSPAQLTGKTNIHLYQNQRQESKENEQNIINREGFQITSHENQKEETKISFTPWKKNLMLQRSQLQKLDQFFNKRDDQEQDNFIKEEEEDEDDLILNRSNINNNKNKNKNQMENFLNNSQDLSIIKEKTADIKQPLGSLNIQKFQRNSISQQKQSSSYNRYQSKDIQSILNELDQQDVKQKVFQPQNYQLNSIRKSIGYKKNVKHLTQSAISLAQLGTNSVQSPSNNIQSPINNIQSTTNQGQPRSNSSQPQVRLKILKSNINPILEGNKLLKQNLIMLNNNDDAKQQQQMIKSQTSTNNFFSQISKQNPKSSHLKQRYQQQDVNQIMSQNFLQDIQDLRKKLQRQTLSLRAIHV